MTHKRSAGLGLALAMTLFAGPRAAHACGGCFGPPNTAQVVTGHRMVLSLSATQTTLWDQFKYGGSPTDFSWILPIHYDPAMQVRIADDRFITMLDNAARPILLPPPAAPSQNCFSGAGIDAGARADSGAYDAQVTVYREEAVGPYEVVILGSNDPTSITVWLQRNGYGVPTAVQPVIQSYVDQHMDFIALKLRPDVGVSQIAPVRISFAGYQPVLPLRMIAAGASDRVGLTLTVISAARIEAMNFPNGEIREDALVYDYQRPTSQAQDLENAFQSLNAASGNRLWLTESSMDETRDQLDSLARAAIDQSPVDAGTGCDAGAGDGGAMMSCAPSDAIDDVATAFVGLGTTARVTRLRADLTYSALDRELMLQASDLGLRDRYYHYGSLLNMPTQAPPCGMDAGTHDAASVVADGGDAAVVGRDAASIGRDAGSPGDGGSGGTYYACSAGPVRGARSGAATLAISVVAAGIARLRRRRARA